MDIKKFINDICIAIISFICVYILVMTIVHVFRLDRYGASKIDWEDCVRVNNTMYYGDFNNTTVEDSLVGEKLGKVKFTADGNVGNGDYRFRNWDAAYLPVGTEIHSIPSKNNAIAIKVNGKYFIYISDLENRNLYFRND